MTMMTISQLFKRHKEENPESVLALRAIRNACKTKELPNITSGNRVLVCWDTFNRWLSGDLNRACCEGE